MPDSGPAEVYESIKKDVLDLLRRSLKPEFLNRIDEIVVFKSLTAEEIARIVKIEFAAMVKNLAARGIGAVLSEKAAVFIAREGFDPQFGARPLKRAIKRLITNEIANGILSGKFKTGGEISIDFKAGKLTFTPTFPAQATDSNS
jgi:ATP-dependent Clp protease ATP-binding subunit ClpA